MISPGSPVPSAKAFRHGVGKPESFDIADYVATGTTVLVGLPAAFSPTCTDRQLPDYVKNSDKIKASGVDRIACLSVNDSFVMQAWGKSLGVEKSGIEMIADCSANFTRAIGADVDLSAVGLNTRSTRYAMVIKEGVVVAVLDEESPGDFRASSTDEVLKALQGL